MNTVVVSIFVLLVMVVFFTLFALGFPIIGLLLYHVQDERTLLDHVDVSH